MMSSSATASAKPTIATLDQLKAFKHQHGIVKMFLFLGNGPRYQYDNIEDLNLQVETQLRSLLPGSGRWMALFGGDTYVPEKPDLGAVIKFIKAKYQTSVHLVAVQW